MKQSKIVSVKTDESTGDGLIMLEDLKDFVDITQVVSYSLDPILDENQKPVGLILKFFDKNGQEIKNS